MLHQRGQQHVLPGHEIRKLHPGARFFLIEDRFLDGRAACPAAFFGPGDTGVTRIGFGRLPDGGDGLVLILPRAAFFGGEYRHIGRVCLDPRTHGGSIGGFLRVIVEIHGCFSALTRASKLSASLRFQSRGAPMTRPRCRARR